MFSKLKFRKFSRKNVFTDLYLYGKKEDALNSVDRFRDFGVDFTTDWSFPGHIDGFINKSFRRIDYIFIECQSTIF